MNARDRQRRISKLQGQIDVMTTAIDLTLAQIRELQREADHPAQRRQRLLRVVK